MDEKMRFQIFSGPLDEEWLVAELLYGEEMWGELIEWGETLIFYPRQSGEPWRFSTKDVLTVIAQAQARVRPQPNER